LSTALQNYSKRIVTPLERSIVSFGANIFKSILSFATVILLARGLGPKEYGVFAFLLASFTALRSLLDMGTSHAFFSFISKRNRSKQFIGYYLLWITFQFFISIAFIAYLAPTDWVSTIWEGQARDRVIIAFIAVFLQQQIWTTIGVLAESQRFTAMLQTLHISIVMLHLMLIVLLFWFESLSIEWVYWLIIGEYVVVSFFAFRIFPLTYSEEREKFTVVFKEYSVFCLPLIPYFWLGMISEFADTWLLQRYGGAVEQAYYSVAARFSAISLIATTSVLRILWKEVAEANHLGNQKKVQRLYEKTNRALFMISAIISGFLIPWTEDIIYLMLGEKYMAGTLVMGMMFLYPIHQSLGQVNGTMFYALELTRPYVMIGMVRMIIAIITVYFLLAPTNALIPGFALASTGLALKMVVLNIIGVNFSIWWLSRRQGWKYHIGYQLIGIVVLLAAGYLSQWLVSLLLGEGVHFLLTLAVSGILYLAMTLGIILLLPWLIDMTKDELLNYCHRAAIRLKLIKS